MIFTSLLDTIKPTLKVAGKWGLENLFPSFEFPKQDMSNPLLMSVTYQAVNGRATPISQRQQGLDMQRRISGIVRQVNTTNTISTKPAPDSSRNGNQAAVRSAAFPSPFWLQSYFRTR